MHENRWTETADGGNSSDEKDWSPPGRRKRKLKSPTKSTSRNKKAIKKPKRYRNKKNRISHGKWQVVWPGKVRVRDAPSLNARVDDFLSKDDIVDVIEVKGPWIYHSKGWSLAAVRLQITNANR